MIKAHVKSMLLFHRFSIGLLCTKKKTKRNNNNNNNQKNQLDRHIQFINGIIFFQNPLLQPCITPRFAPSTTPALLQGLGDLVREYDIPVQV